MRSFLRIKVGDRQVHIVAAAANFEALDGDTEGAKDGVARTGAVALGALAVYTHRVWRFQDETLSMQISA
jgi:hypothetical protein